MALSYKIRRAIVSQSRSIEGDTQSACDAFRFKEASSHLAKHLVEIKHVQRLASPGALMKINVDSANHLKRAYRARCACVC
jgi:hypothetical protein